ncbi:MAG: 4-hydroxybenzoyl-CoA reductase subunit beta [Rhodospirillaceae bacterium]|nr:4-hydroxybenzoyl-CoA reductase subunit beta [Rhodospirillaceae bacterium]|tara:strand:- start:2657 stop:3637 length:981 start_codon:yes stop_codon:yes gene_type:complete
MELMPNFDLHRPTEVEEAVKLRAETDGALYVAGGTDMIVNVRRGIEQPAALIDLSSVQELQEIVEDNEGLHIGASVTLQTVTNDRRIQAEYTGVAEAAAAVAGPTHQSYGTVGGNLCLDTRCLFYNQSEWWRKSNDYCMKERGDICHVAPGGKRCFAAFSGDVAPTALIHNAEVDLVGPNGRRRVPLTDIYRNDGMNHLAIEPGELLTVLHLPKTEAGQPSAYEKARVRGSIDFPLAGAAVWLKQVDGKVEELRIALTAVNPYPQLVKKLDKFSGTKLDDSALDEIAEMVQSQAKPMRTTTVKPWYRRRVVGAIARRLTAKLSEAR